MEKRSIRLIQQLSLIYQSDGKSRGLEFYFPDRDQTVQLLLDAEAEVATESFKPYTTRFEFSTSTFVSVFSGELNGQLAYMQGKIVIKGDMSIVFSLNRLFGLS